MGKCDMSVALHDTVWEGASARYGEDEEVKEEEEEEVDNADAIQ